MMEVSFTKGETLKLIEEYYSKLEGRNVKAQAKSSRGLIGYYEDEGCITEISVTENIEIAGMNKEVKEVITTEQLRTLLKSLFGLYEFDMSDLTLNDGLNSRCEGYGMGEHEVKTAYFNGITVNVQKKKNYGFTMDYR